MKQLNALMADRSFGSPSREKGFTLIELLVGILVSRISALAMMAVFAAFEGPKRTTTSGDDAQQNGSYSLFQLERQIRTAGSGLTQGNKYGVWGCLISGYFGGAQVMPSATALPAPFSSWPQSTPATPVRMAAMPASIALGWHSTLPATPPLTR